MMQFYKHASHLGNSSQLCFPNPCEASSQYVLKVLCQACNTHTRHIWTHNACGHDQPQELERQSPVFTAVHQSNINTPRRDGSTTYGSPGSFTHSISCVPSHLMQLKSANRAVPKW